MLAGGQVRLFSGHILTAIGERKSLEEVLGSLCGTISVFRGAEHRHWRELRKWKKV